MDFSFSTKPISKFANIWQAAFPLMLQFSFGEKICNLFSVIAFLLLGLMLNSEAQAAGNAEVGQAAWIKTCQHCHGRPQPDSDEAFSDYGITANKLSVYASDPAAITKTATEGYTVPEGNTNDKIAVGSKSREEMGTFAGMAPNKLGLGTTPTQYAMDIAAYLATFFDMPTPPTISSVTIGNAQASVSFTAPGSDLAITSYTVTANPGGFKVTGTSSPIAVSGLTNGTAYTFTVTATSNAGTSQPSSPSKAVTTLASAVTAFPGALHSAPAMNTAAVAATPSFDRSAPIIVNTRAGNAQARVFFTVPSGIAATVANYTVTALSGGVTTGITATGSKSPITISGLNNGTNYTFTVTAHSNTGSNLLSPPSDTVTPLRILGD